MCESWGCGLYTSAAYKAEENPPSMHTLTFHSSTLDLDIIVRAKFIKTPLG